MRDLLRWITDLRVLWITAPVLGNLIFLPVLAMGFVHGKTSAAPRPARWMLGLGICFFAYFALRGLVALPSPGLGDSLSRILPIPILGLILYFRKPVQTKAFPIALVWVMTCIVLFLCLIELAILPSSGRRVELLAGNPLFLTPALLPLVYLNAWLAVRSGSVRTAFLHYAALFIVLFVIGTLAGSRSPMLVSLGVLGLHLLFCLALRPASWPRMWGHAGLVGIIGASTLALASLSGSAASKFMSFFAASIEGEAFSEAGDIRFVIWKAAWEALQLAPVWGYGPQNRFAAAAPFVEEGITLPALSHPHNFVLTMGLAGGIVGIALGFAYMFGPTIASLLTKGTSWAEREMMALGAIGLTVFGMVNYILFEGFMAVSTTLALIGPIYLLRGLKDPRYKI